MLSGGPCTCAAKLLCAAARCHALCRLLFADTDPPPHFRSQVRLLSPQQLRLLHLDPKLSRLPRTNTAEASPSPLSPRGVRNPRIATLSTSSELKWCVV